MKDKVIINISANHQRGISRRLLAGKWQMVLLATLVYMMAMTIPTTIIQAIFSDNIGMASSISLIYLLVTMGAFSLGYSSFILKVFRNQETSPGEVFSGFSSFGRSLRIVFMMLIIIWAFCIPSALVLVLGGSIPGAPKVIFVIIAILLFYLPIKASLSMAQVIFLAVDFEKMPVLELLKQSKFLMEGNIWHLICLDLSFIGWSLLFSLPQTYFNVILLNSNNYIHPLIEGMVTLLLSVGYLWLTPYMCTANAGFYEIISGRLAVKLTSDFKLSNEDVELDKPMVEKVDVELDKPMVEKVAVELEKPTVEKVAVEEIKKDEIK